MYCKIKVTLNSKIAYSNAIIDTGNFLKDPITKIPVIVVQKDELIDIIPDYVLNNIDKIINGEDVELGDYISKIRLIPFTSLGKENGILLGLRADSVAVQLEENTINIGNVIIGIYNGRLSKNGKYKSLVGLELLENSNTNNESIINS